MARGGRLIVRMVATHPVPSTRKDRRKCFKVLRTTGTHRALLWLARAALRAMRAHNISPRH